MAVLRIFVVFGLLCLFCRQCWKSVEKLRENRIGIDTRSEPAIELLVPNIHICDMYGFDHRELVEKWTRREEIRQDMIVRYYDAPGEW